VKEKEDGEDASSVDCRSTSWYSHPKPEIDGGNNHSSMCDAALRPDPHTTLPLCPFAVRECARSQYRPICSFTPCARKMQLAGVTQSFGIHVLEREKSNEMVLGKFSITQERHTPHKVQDIGRIPASEKSLA
jgi:hypothetical protein